MSYSNDTPNHPLERVLFQYSPDRHELSGLIGNYEVTPNAYSHLWTIEPYREQWNLIAERLDG